MMHFQAIARVLAIAVALAASNSIAQIATDGTVGSPATSLTGPDFTIDHTLGLTSGTNLFHSFSDFNVHGGESATFTGPNSISNVLSRVTGGNASVIDGTLRSTIEQANLYLINPAGLVFGANSQVDVDGAFHTSTAEYIDLADGARFDALHFGAAPNVTSATPSAFGFYNDDPASITINGTSIVNDGVFSVVGGNITVAGRVDVPGGTVNLASRQAAGDVTMAHTSEGTTFDPGDTDDLGSILLTGSGLTPPPADPTSASAGVFADGTSAGTIVVQAGFVDIADGAALQASSDGGSGGTIEVRADAVVITGRSGSSFTGIRAEARSMADDVIDIARQAEVDIQTATLEIYDGGVISTSTLGATAAGRILINAVDAIILDARSAPAIEGAATGIISDTRGAGAGGQISITAGSLAVRNLSTRISTDAFGNGSGGDITIVADAVNILGYAQLAVNTSGVGNGGRLSLHAEGTIVIDGQGTNTTGIVAETRSQTNDAGSGGDVSIRAGTLMFLNGGIISATTIGPGDGGSVDIVADTIFMDDVAASDNKQTGIVAGTTAEMNGGRGGDVAIESGSLTIVNGARINVTTDSGPSGTVTIVNSGRILLDGVLDSALPTRVQTGIAAQSTGSAQSADVTIQTKVLDIFDGAIINTASRSSGSVGNMSLTAESISIVSGDAGLRTGVVADIQGAMSMPPGPGGMMPQAAMVDENASMDVAKISIDTGSLELLGGNAQISAATAAASDGSTITVTADTVFIDAFGMFDATAMPPVQTGILAVARGQGTGAAGDIVVGARTVLLRQGAQIVATTRSLGEGGLVMVTAVEQISIESTELSSNIVTGIFAESMGTNSGDGDGVMVMTDRLDIAGPGSLVSATTFGQGNGGNVDVTADSILIDGQGALRSLGIVAESIGLGAIANAGRGGSITIRATDIEIVDHGAIQTSTQGTGKGGTVEITAESIFIDGRNSQSFTGIAAESRSQAADGGTGGNIMIGGIGAASLTLVDNGAISTNTLGNGEGGTIAINIPTIEVTSGGLITANTRGSGQGGTIQIQSDSLHVAGPASGTLGGTGIIAESLDGATGKGGNIVIATGSLELANQARVSTTTHTTGIGGNIMIAADTIRIEGAGEFRDNDSPPQTGITAQTVASIGGRGGNIDIDVDDLQILDGLAVIAATTHGSGQGGEIEIRADTILLDRRNSLTPISGIFAESTAETNGGDGGMVTISARSTTITNGASVNTSTQGNGEGGPIQIHTDTLSLLNNSRISSESRANPLDPDSQTVTAGDAGSIAIEAGDSVRILNGSAITTASAAAGGGAITINAPVLVYLLNSEITTSAQGSENDDDGGDISIDPLNVVLNNSSIIANAFGGNGGNITIVANHFFTSNTSVVQASSRLGISGTIEITSPDTDLTAGLIPLNADFLDAATWVVARCTAEMQESSGSFVISGHGGVPAIADDLLPYYGSFGSAEFGITGSGAGEIIDIPELPCRNCD